MSPSEHPRRQGACRERQEFRGRCWLRCPERGDGEGHTAAVLRSMLPCRHLRGHSHGLGSLGGLCGHHSRYSLLHRA